MLILLSTFFIGGGMQAIPTLNGIYNGIKGAVTKRNIAKLAGALLVGGNLGGYLGSLLQEELPLRWQYITTMLPQSYDFFYEILYRTGLCRTYDDSSPLAFNEHGKYMLRPATATGYILGVYLFYKLSARLYDAYAKKLEISDQFIN